MSLKEGRSNTEGIIVELDNYMSRKNVALVAAAYEAMTVLGLVAVSPIGVTPGATNTGNGAMGAVTIGATAKVGTYKLKITGTGATAAFDVTDPDGVALTAGAVGSAYNQGGISFTLADGAVDFVPGDTFDIRVAAVATALGTNTGNGTVGNITTTAAVIPGNHTVTFIEPATNLGTFVVRDPTGKDIGHGVVGSAFSAGGLSFTIADGSTDFVAGDQFTIKVGGGSGKYAKIDAASLEGLDDAVGVLIEGIDATSAPMQGAMIFRDADLVKGSLVWPAGWTDNQKNAALAQLEARGIRAF